MLHRSSFINYYTRYEEAQHGIMSRFQLQGQCQYSNLEPPVSIAFTTAPLNSRCVKYKRFSKIWDTVTRVSYPLLCLCIYSCLYIMTILSSSKCNTRYLYNKRQTNKRTVLLTLSFGTFKPSMVPMPCGKTRLDLKARISQIICEHRTRQRLLTSVTGRMYFQSNVKNTQDPLPYIYVPINDVFLSKKRWCYCYDISQIGRCLLSPKTFKSRARIEG